MPLGKAKEITFVAVYRPESVRDKPPPLPTNNVWRPKPVALPLLIEKRLVTPAPPSGTGATLKKAYVPAADVKETTALTLRGISHARVGRMLRIER
jgi:hypothetical protein